MRIPTTSRLIQWIVGISISLYIIILLALNTMSVQEFFAQQIEETLENKLNTQIKIQRVEIGLFNNITLHKVTIKDQKNKDLLNSKLIFLKLEILPLLKSQISIRNLALLDTHFKLYKAHQTDPINAQFIINSFRSKDNGPSKLNLRINSLILRRCTLNFDQWDIPQTSLHKFSTQHLGLQQLNLNLSLKYLTNDSINLRVRQCSLKEQCGLQLDALQFRIIANKKSCHIEHLKFITPYSNFSQHQIKASYDGNSWDTFLNTLTWKGKLTQLQISSIDLAYFFPLLKGINETLILSTEYQIRPNKLQFQNLILINQAATLKLSSNLIINRKNTEFQIIKANKTKLYIKKDLSTKIFSKWIKKPSLQPLITQKDFSLSGDFFYHWNRSGQFSGNLSSSIGALNGKIAFRQRTLYANLSTSDLDLSSLSNNSYIPKQIACQLQTSLSFPQNQHPNGSIKLNISKIQNPHYHFQDISLIALLSPKENKLRLSCQDPNAQLTTTLSAQINNHWQLSKLNLESHISYLATSILGLNKKGETGSLTGHLSISTPFLSLKYPRGQIRLENINWTHSTSQEKYTLNSLIFNIKDQLKGVHISLRSDFADLDYEGPDQMEQLRSLGHNFIESVIKKIDGNSLSKVESPIIANSSSTAIVLQATLKKSDIIQQLFDFDIKFPRPIKLSAKLHPTGQLFQCDASAPEFTIQGETFKEFIFQTKGSPDSINLLTQTLKPLPEGTLKLIVSFCNKADTLQSKINWDELQAHQYHGELLTKTTLRLATNKEDYHIKTKILPSEFCIRDSLWTMQKGELTFNNGVFNIDHLSLNHANQNIIASGTYAHHADGIRLQLKNIDVASAMSFTKLEVVNFGGLASGEATIKPTSEGKFGLNANLLVPQFIFNHEHLGTLSVKGGFEGGDERIFFNGQITEKDLSHTNVNGFVSLKQKILDILIKGENTQLGFLNKYLDGIFENLSGRMSGTCRIFGTFRNVDFEGHEYGYASAYVPVNGVKYNIYDAEVKIRPGQFKLLQAKLSNDFSGKGEIQGTLNHQHLRDMRYDFSMKGSHIMLYNKGYDSELPFYSTAYGTGDVRIWGEPNQLNADINIKTEEGSTLTYLLDSPSLTDNKLLHFQDITPNLSYQDPNISQKIIVDGSPSHQTPESDTDIYLKMKIDVQPSATIHMITDTKSGDLLTVHGHGALQATYHNKSAFEMFGTYYINNGNYDVSVQNVIRKTFHLDKGGTVHFSGRPTAAEAKVTASYWINSASLADLNLGMDFSNNTTPVQCLIYFTGEVGNMNLKLDFDLPNVGEDEKQMVKKLISTDEERTTQVLYLLGVGRFFTYNYNVAATNQSQSTIMMKSLLTSTISSQLNNIIAHALGNSTWSFGTNLSTGQIGWSDMEVDGKVSGHMLNHRLLVNGKVGYHDRQTATTNFIGDFDVQYLLTPTGNLNLKAYSETNNRYFTKSALTTQGIGLQFKRDFVLWKDLFKRKRKNAAQTSSNRTP